MSLPFLYPVTQFLSTNYNKHSETVEISIILINAKMFLKRDGCRLNILSFSRVLNCHNIYYSLFFLILEFTVQVNQNVLNLYS